jgi:hypothetical protein
MDIDFAVQVLNKPKPTADLSDIISFHGFISFFTQSGIQKFSREGFLVEFIGQRPAIAMKSRSFRRNGMLRPSPYPL